MPTILNSDFNKTYDCVRWDFVELTCTKSNEVSREMDCMDNPMHFHYLILYPRQWSLLTMLQTKSWSKIRWPSFALSIYYMHGYSGKETFYTSTWEEDTRNQGSTRGLRKLLTKFSLMIPYFYFKPRHTHVKLSGKSLTNFVGYRVNLSARESHLSSSAVILCQPL